MVDHRATVRAILAGEREQFGRPIADFQLVQAMIADSKADRVAFA